MARQTGAYRPDGRSQRKAKGFLSAGGLITGQMQTAQAKRGFALARLQAHWNDIAGVDLSGTCWPARLATARGPAGGLLTLAVEGAHAPMVQMMVPTLRERINGAMGPNTVGRIQLRHAAGLRPEAEPQRQPVKERPAPKPLPADMAEQLSSIGDEEFRNALETLAQNVLSRR